MQHSTASLINKWHRNWWCNDWMKYRTILKNSSITFGQHSWPTETVVLVSLFQKVQKCVLGYFLYKKPWLNRLLGVALQHMQAVHHYEYTNFFWNWLNCAKVIAIVPNSCIWISSTQALCLGGRARMTLRLSQDLLILDTHLEVLLRDHVISSIRMTLGQSQPHLSSDQ